MIAVSDSLKNNCYSPISSIPHTPLVQLMSTQLSGIEHWPVLTITSTNLVPAFGSTLKDTESQVSPYFKSKEISSGDKMVEFPMFNDPFALEVPQDLDSFILKDTIAEMDKSLDEGLNFATGTISVIGTQAATSYTSSESLVLNSPQSNANPMAKFLVIKSYNELDIIAGFRNSCWSSTKLGNKRLQRAYEINNGQNVYLFFSVNGSGHFCAVAQMVGPVDFEKDAKCWSDPKWKGSFPIKFILIKDIPNKVFKNLTIPMVKNGARCISSVVTSRDTQELPFHVGEIMMNTFINQNSVSSLLTNF